MIHGLGTDIVAVQRLRRLLERYGERAVAKVLAPWELAGFQAAADPARFLAKRWAAKEAFAKAFGTGVRGVVTLTGVGVCNDELGKPLLRYGPDLQTRLDELGLRGHVTLSDEADYAVAFVILERAGA